MPERNPGVCCFRCRGRLLYLQNPQRIYKVNKKSSIYEFLFYSVLIAEVFKIKCAVLKNLQRQVALCEYLLSAAKHYPRKQPKKLGTILKIGRIDKKKKKNLILTGFRNVLNSSLLKPGGLIFQFLSTFKKKRYQKKLIIVIDKRNEKKRADNINQNEPTWSKMSLASRVSDFLCLAKEQPKVVIWIKGNTTSRT